MNQLQDLTEMVVASWVVGGGEARIPTSHGILDNALRLAIERGAFSDKADAFHFVDSRIGWQCLELPGILDWAQRSQFTTAPNPSYQHTQVKVTERVARIILNDLKISEEDARSWGQILAEAVEEARRSLEEFAGSDIEEY